MENKTKVLIIGSGPAGWTAAIYAARANLEPIIVSGDQPGGQLTITTGVENYPGFADVIQGPWLMEQMKGQASHCGAKIVNDHIDHIDFSGKPFRATDRSGNIYIAEAVIIATGAQAKWLGIDSETEFRGYGVSGCATCDGFFFKKKPVLIVGGGNTAVEEALYLTNHASHVTLVHRRDSFKAEKILQDRLFKNEKISVIWDSEIAEICGEKKPLKYVTGAKIRNVKTGNVTDLAFDGVFIAIGHRPNTDIFKGIIELDNEGYIITKSGTTNTNIEGVFACGDVQDKIYRQAVTAAGTGCMAALDVERFLNSK